MSAVVEGAALPKGLLSVGLQLGEPLVENWSRVKHLLDGWALPQNWESVETPGAVELALSEIEDCLEVLSGHVAAGIVGCLYLKIVERDIKERDKLQGCLEELGTLKRDSYSEVMLHYRKIHQQ